MVALRIAIADDERDMRDYLARSLPRLGYEVVAAAENGRQLVEACHREQPQLVITDVRMPELDGIDAVQLIWQKAEIPIVFLSAFHHEERLHAASAEHVFVHLEKPVKLPALNQAIQLAQAKHNLDLRMLHAASPAASYPAIRRFVDRAIATVQNSESLDELAAIRFLERNAATLEALHAKPEDG